MPGGPGGLAGPLAGSVAPVTAHRHRANKNGRQTRWLVFTAQRGGARPWGPHGESFRLAVRLSRRGEDSKLRTTKDFIGVPLVPNYLVVVAALTFGTGRTKEDDCAPCNDDRRQNDSHNP
ncbi:hypothetical protein Bbelb_136940 [Branchiostoma belcheri]|nr:hypothetical protein Bbelb_136940 [Branchiostoma belcheri]